ncbi:MAG: transglutaminase domain-containing protein [Reinekea sp.]
MPDAADLVATIDAPLSPEILAHAEALGNDYIRIYEFVKNNIQTQWYAGSMKGAVGTLRQRSGNDVDQANLLIALFRASGLASRYVHGVIELPIEAVMDSLGLANANQAIRALGQAGVAHSPVIRGGRVVAVNVAHTWVSAYVPYTNYRGALVDTSGSIWLPLMPAMKSYQVQAASGLFQQAGLAADDFVDNYLQKPQSQDLLEQIVEQVNDYLLQNQSDTKLASQLGNIK